MKKSTRIIRNIGITLLVLLILLTGVWYLIYQHQAYGIVSAFNSNAHSHYSAFQSEYASLETLPDLPEDCVLFGECRYCWDYVVYANDFLPEDMLLCGKAEESANCYWAARIQNGKVIEVWSANYPLSEEQLLPYSRKDQEKQIHFPEKFYKSGLIGYYHAE